jgi:hypothetical protein
MDNLDPKEKTEESPTVIPEVDAVIPISDTPFEPNQSLPSEPTISIDIAKDYSLSKTSIYKCTNSVPITLKHKCIGCACHS